MNGQVAVLKDFVLKRAKENDLSLRKISADLGITHSYLSLILNGKRPLDIVLGNKIADYFKMPRVVLYEMVGWLDIYEDELFLERFKDYSKKQKDLVEIVEAVMKIEDKEKRKQILKFIRAGMEK
ncbi:MAG TPA: helix-turn-helix transcriptional regulator [Anaerolineales bacterium]|nr:helix-turn-helix transcriptional regulator [Anaerolineales bacterium]